MNETLTVNAEGRNVLRMERRLTHAPAKVWRALTEPDQLSQWFPATATEVDLRVGGAVRVSLGSNPEMSSELTDELPITQMDPPRLFEFRWSGEILRWELHPEDTGCRLVFVHVFDDRAGAASFASGWQLCFDAMDAVLDGTPVEHASPSAELHDSYVDRFGLDTGTVDETPSGWRVRFERQLTAPAEQAWSVLTEGTPRIGEPAPADFTAEPVRAGSVTAVEAPTMLEYQWLAASRPVGTVRWEIRDEAGTGHGARLTVTQTGPGELTAERDAALTAWPARIRALAKSLM